ncbi:MAG: anthranilate synthase component I, partial [Xanthobacteraceae bacterium]
MQIETVADNFSARYAAGAAQVIWTTLVADLETPVSVFLKLTGDRSRTLSPDSAPPIGFLFESVEGGAVRGRYSIIGLEPDVIFRVTGHAAEINRDPKNNPRGFAPAGDAPLT